MSALTVEDVQCLIDRAKRENIEIPIFCTYHFLPVKYLITSNSYITETFIKGLKDVQGQHDYVGSPNRWGTLPDKHGWYSNYWFAYAACRKLHRK